MKFKVSSQGFKCGLLHQLNSHDLGLQAVITLPVYLNANRKDVLFSAEFRLASGQSQAAIVEKGVAVVANA